MQPRLLKTFLAVVQHGKMTRAAAELNLTQSSVSEQVQALEADLGLPLFKRSSRGLELTPAGETLISHAQELLNLGDEARIAVTATSDKDRGRLSIGSLETIAAGMLARQLADFRSGFPSIDVNVLVEGSGVLVQLLKNGVVDVVFCFDKGERDNRFIYRAIADEPLFLIAPGGPGQDAWESDAAALALRPYISTQRGCVYRKLFEDAFEQAGMSAPTPAAEVGSVQTILRMVAAGAGWAIVPSIAAAELLASGGVVEIPWPALKPKASIIAVWRRRRVQSAPLAQFLTLVGASSFKPAGVRPRRAEPYQW